MYINEPLRKYLDDLAARSPTPGGGSAAALAASLGVSLMMMAANFTIGNPKYKDVEGEAADLITKLSKFSLELRDLIDKDVEAYKKLSKGIKECRENATKLDEVYKEATNPVFEICKITSVCLKLCKTLAKIGNVNLITDTAAAAILLEGAFFAAKFNVYINLKYIKDLEYVERIHDALFPVETEMPKLKDEILEICEEVIAK